MNKRYLPAIASIFVLALLASSIIPVQAQVALLSARAVPSLQVLSIPQDDQVRKTGIILLGMTVPSFDIEGFDPSQFITIPGARPGWPMSGTTTYADLMAQYKILVSYNGVPVAATLVGCQIVEKDKVNALKDKQGPWENVKTVPVDASDRFTCKMRWGKPGVGVLDLYWIGPVPKSGTAAYSELSGHSVSQDVAVGQYIADYIVNLSFAFTIGRTTIYGTEMQDVCVLGWPSVLAMLGSDIILDVTGVENGDYAHGYYITKPDGSLHVIYFDALGLFTSCEDMALLEQAALGMPISWS